MNKQVRRLLRAAKPYRAVGLDVFDTLLRRDVAAPADLFALLEQSGAKPAGFAAARLAAEAAARAAHHGQESTLAQIYAGLNAAYGDAAAECAAELAAVVPAAELLDFCRACHARGQKLYAVSDMYLPRAQIEAMLRRCGYDFLDGVFVSAEYGVQKRSGKLFARVLADTGLRRSQLVFVGDSWRADVLGAAAAGVRALHLACPPPIVAAGPAAGAYAAFARNRAGVSSPAEQLGFAVLGPLLTAFARWLHAEKAARGKTKLLFLARDMYLVREIYQLLYPGEDTAYLIVSRRSLCPAVLAAQRETLLAAVLPRENLRVETLLDHCGFAPGTVLPGVPAGGMADLRAGVPAPLAAALFALAKTRPEIAEQVALAREYLQSAGVGEPGALLVDIGSGGSTQRALCALCAPGLAGLYLACDARLAQAFSPERAGVFLFQGAPAPLAYWAGQTMLELLISEPCGATAGYRRTPQRPEPVRRAVALPPELAQIQAGALRYARELPGTLPAAVVLPPQAAVEPFLRLVQSPTRAETELLGGFFVEDGERNPLAAPRKIRYYMLRPAAFTADFSAARWKIGFIKRLAPLPLPYARIYGALKKQKGW